MRIIIAERHEANNRPIIATYRLRISASVYIAYAVFKLLVQKQAEIWASLLHKFIK